MDVQNKESSTPDSIWIPGKFIPKPASQLENNWFMFSPFGWEGLLYVAPVVPAAVIEYFIFNGYPVIGAICLVLWSMLIWLLLVDVHNSGRLRCWISAPAVTFCYLVFGSFYAGWMS